MFEDEGFYEMDMPQYDVQTTRHRHPAQPGGAPAYNHNDVNNNNSFRQHQVISKRICERRNQLIELEEELSAPADLQQLTNAYQRLLK